jgi:hypothetical protein
MPSNLGILGGKESGIISRHSTKGAKKNSSKMNGNQNYFGVVVAAMQSAWNRLRVPVVPFPES